MNLTLMQRALDSVRARWPDAKPVTGAILGSGWGEAVAAFEHPDRIAYEDLEGLGKPGVEGHSGMLIRARAAGMETLIFQGRRHFYEGEGWTPIALPIFVLKGMGVRNLVITNAAGGIREDLTPGTFMIIDDHINFMGANPLIGPHQPEWGVRFPDQSKVYSPKLRAIADRAAANADEPVRHGVYLAGTGPTYETPAEIRAFRALGADAVGMSTVPEALLANAAGLRVLGISCITNLAAGISESPLTHEEVTETTQSVMPRMKALFLQLWKELAVEVGNSFS